ncbi:tetratricopeptide repeat protein [Alteromonas sp. ASW11-36]|uniref:Tetratricopeptide repeat protein n=1 Tax=Alteromonas arenosi TaxID=3055817 RepID=A0ABT7SSB7_9ALTE|nr:tetratricopeptide repeat protein [Alteromonas sp. ASW11-36]MDM7859089.1 tetratricopeptide repeat protein [Alteromonas sp. ASW11-36]
MDVLVTAKLEINLEQRTVSHNQQVLPIKGLTFDMLLALVEARNHIVSLEELSLQVWKGKVVSDDTIAQRISLLRKALPNDSENYIESVRSEGYRWLPAIKKQQTEDEPKRKSPLTMFAIGAMAVFSILFMLWFSAYKPQPEAIPTVQKPIEHGLDISVYTRVKLARAQQYASAPTAEANRIAIKMYRDLYADNQDDILVAFGLARVLIDNVAQFDGDRTVLPEVEAISRELLLQQPTEPRFLWLRGYYFEVIGELPTAIDHFESAAQLDSADASVSLSLASLYVEKGRLFDAMSLYLRQLSDNQRYPLASIGYIFHLTEQPELAREWYAAAVQLNPDNDAARIRFAQFLITQNEHQQALDTLLELHRLTGGTVDSHLTTLSAALLLNEQSIVTDSLQQALQLSPNDFNALAWRAWLDYQAGEPIKTALDRIPLSEQSHPELYVAKSILALAHEDIETALVMLSRAQRLGYMDYRYIEQLMPFEQLADNRLFRELLLMMQARQATQRERIDLLTIPTLSGD